MATNRTLSVSSKANSTLSDQTLQKVTASACKSILTDIFCLRPISRFFSPLFAGMGIGGLIVNVYRFKDSVACIRRTSTQYQYQLVIQRAYEEGEEQLIDDAEDADDLKDEKVFLLDESLKLRSTTKDGESVFAWRDLSGVRLNNFFFSFVYGWAQMQGFI